MLHLGFKILVLVIFFALSSISISSLANPRNPNNPTNGYCQTIDPSACGWYTPSAPPEPNYYIAAAIAFSGSPNAVQAWIGPTQRIAENGALKQCNKYFDECQIIVSAYKECIAIAREDLDKRFGYTKSASVYIEKAEDEAMQYCHFDAVSADKCKLVHSSCPKM